MKVSLLDSLSGDRLYDQTRSYTIKLETNVMRLDIRKHFFHKEYNFTGMLNHKQLLMQTVIIISRVN